MTEVPYAELHAHSNFSFLDGASPPEALVVEAARLGLSGLALTDHDGLYGVVRFAEAARRVGLPAVFGAELTLGLPKRQNGVADPEGRHLVVLARDPTGYAQLSRAIGEAQLAGGSKGKPVFGLDQLAAAHDGHWLVLTGCRKGTVPAALADEGPAAAGRELDRLVEAFGPEDVAVELWHHDTPLDSARNDALARLAVERGTELVATSNAHYATPAGQHLAAALAAVRARRSLDEMDGWLPAGPAAHLRSGAEQARRFARFPGVVERSGELGGALAFDLRLLAPGLPPFPVPAGHDEMSFLRTLVDQGATDRYGPRGAERVPGAWAQLDRELTIIEQLGFPGYFLVVWDIVTFCRRSDILCQGRGSAANSAVCYAIGITNADAVALGLLFERFLSTERDGPPDIDVDIESGRREEAIQYVYERHGRRNAAQVANVITYRPRSAIRDAAKALGHAPGTVDAWSKQLERHGRLAPLVAEKDPDGHPAHDIPDEVVALAAAMEDFPRHLGVHSGGMVICDRPITEVCPVEWATAPGRTVLQWDKDDCATIGLVKFDLLGLGMLEALHRTIDLVADFDGTRVDLAALPQDPAVYRMLCRADTVGVFQVESRAQMGTLPRLKPTGFYDLVVEVALIRPGPIQGGSVHPYLRRRNGEEEITFLHPLLEPCLKRTLGVPLFQEQLMQMAIDVAGFSRRRGRPAPPGHGVQAVGRPDGGAAGPLLRRHGAQRHLRAGGRPDLVEDGRLRQLRLPRVPLGVLRLPGVLERLAEAPPPRRLLRRAAQRPAHGVLGPPDPGGRRPPPRGRCPPARRERQPGGGDPGEGSGDTGRPTVRLGLASVRSVGEEAAERVVAGQPYRDLPDLARRAGLTRTQLEALATAGASPGLDGGDRRRALWAAGALARSGPGQLEGIVVGDRAPRLPTMTETEEVAADLWATGVTVDTSLTELARPALDQRGVVLAAHLVDLPDRTRVTVAGVVTHRQRPETARGLTFVNLEDESGLVNVVCSPGVWARYRRVAQSAPAMVVRGRLESAGGVVNVVAERIERLELAAVTQARNFH